MHTQKKHILYISYDGMTGFLGQSQVIPYLIELRQYGYKFTILSCEKKEKYKARGTYIQKLLQANDINWETLTFSESPPILAKYYDIYLLKKKALQLHQKHQFDMTHCRSYIPADVSRFLKKKCGIKFLFDMRGFWVDERVDGGLWNLKNPFYWLAYQIYKKKEITYLNEADYLISVSKAGKDEMKKWPNFQQTPIEMIPCCTDFNLFFLTEKYIKLQNRENLGFDANALIISYLGSIGTWYLLDEMLHFFAILKETYPTAQFLFISGEKASVIYERLPNFHLKKSDVYIISANRKDVPNLLSVSDISLFFIKKGYSRIACSPTKLGEILAMGIPAIANAEIGDVGEVLEQTKGGIALKKLSEKSFREAITYIPNLLAKNPALIRKNAQKYYDLKQGAAKYAGVYKEILEK
ncbi:MAG: glycosyltransferase [Chitinophagales bacterium]